MRVVAYSTTGDAETGDYDDQATILFQGRSRVGPIRRVNGMDLHRITPANGASEDTGEAEYSISDVREMGDEWGFEVRGIEAGPLTFVYGDRAQAEVGRGAMFQAMANVIAVTTPPCD